MTAMTTRLRRALGGATAPAGAAGLDATLDQLPAPLAASRRERLAVLADVLAGGAAAPGGPETAPDTDPATAPARHVVAALDGAAPARVWLALAVLGGRLPEDPEVTAAVRAIALDGAERYLAERLADRRWGAPERHVEVVTGATLVDLEHTSHTTLATGIQRVARQAAVRWHRDHAIDLVGWTADHTALRRLTGVECDVALHGADRAPDRGPDTAVIVPWRATYVLPELATERERTARLLALARHSGSRTAVIGFDCVPLSTAETVGLGMGAGFAANLAALRHVDRVVAISDAAAVEYSGWRAMLAGTGLAGPEVVAVPLAVETGVPSAEALAATAADLGTDERPLVLCVGSHEPRKNHVAVLEAAEQCWRRGHDFSLVFVGGNAWMSEEFEWRIAELAAAGRPVRSVSAITDATLWAAYRLARCTVFPSLNEGFGLPVAESIAAGTPVLTSDFGSMRELAAHGGALLVDPRDDTELTNALERLLVDDALHGRLEAEALAVPGRSWDAYAAEAWQALVGP